MDLEQVCNNWQDGLSDWLFTNRLQLNAYTTKYISFSSKDKAVNYNLEIPFQNVSIQYTQSHEFLGVIFPESLNWSFHIDAICVDNSRLVSLINMVRFLLPTWLKLHFIMR